METWFLNHVLGLSLAVLLLGLPAPLGAGTPSNNSTDSVTTGFDYSTATDEVSDVENNATSTSYSSESLSPSQRNILLTHTAETHTAAAGNFDTEQTQTFTETSSRSLEAISLSTEPLTSTLVIATTEASSSSISSSSSGSSSSSSSSISSSGSSSSGSSSSISSTISGSGSSSTISSSGSSSSGSISSSGSSSSISSTISSSGSGSSSSSGSISSSGSSSSISSTISGSGSSSSSSSSSTNSSGGSSSSSTIGSSSSSSSSQGWKDFVNTDQVPDVSSAVSSETSSLMLTDETRLPQDSPDTTLRQGDASSSMSHTALHTDSTYTSTTITRAGERTLLSVTSSSSNSTSSVFTEDSNSHQPPSTWGISAKATETEDYTHSALSTRTDSRDTTDQHMTSSFKGTFPETGSPGGPRGTHSLTRQPNGTSHQHTSTSEETSDSTPPLRVTEPSTDQSEVSVSSTPPITSPAEGPTNISGTDQGSGSSVGTSTESSTGVLSSSTENQEGTEGVSSQTSEQSGGFGLTTGPPTVSSSTSGLDNSLTDTTALITEVFPTSTPVTVTERSHITEENTFRATASITPSTTTTTTNTTPSPLPATSSSRFTSAASSSAPGSLTEATILYTTPPTTASSTTALQTSTMHPTHRVSPSQTQGPSTGMAEPTNTTTLQVETSTGALGITTSQSQRITTTYIHSTPTKSTEVQQTTGKRTTELVVTTSPTDFRSTKAPPLPENPCVSNPCMNGGMCVSYKMHQYTCQCQQAWTGPTCNQDMDECENDPCPVGSKCVNRRGSFSCECPLGFDLEDGRTCTRAKTFLGTFSVKKQPHDPVIFKSTTMHEIQREIILLLNASLSAFRGYSRSLLSKKGEDGLHISAVNMFSISTDVTSAEVYNSIQMSLSNCSSSLAHCRMVLHHQLDYHMESLCVAQKTQCDTERSTCADDSGTAHCQCLQGYYKHNPEDQSCLECGDGYKLENGTCVPCMFGFGGFNCGNFYKLIAVVVSPAGGALLLILVIALIVTCCKKDKNDINKIIFKSGDLQMSPYADFAKNNRISMEWGRETIEMQENGSTKNLLQMTDIYYSPALRNSDLERNGLYPFTGLPGSRHSCIYPAQWNPSFISDDSRRRDYF